MKLAAIVLAAGAGRRMGQPKALLSFAGTTFLEHAIATFAACDAAEILAVLDPASPIFEEACARISRGPRARVVENPDADRGMLSSIAAGLRALDASITHAALHPVDHPGVRVETIRALLDAVARAPESIVVPSCEDRRGHPGIFPRSLFGELLSAPEGEGARAVLRKHGGRIEHVLVDDVATIRDVDTPEDLRSRD